MSIEIEYSQETLELADGLGRGTELKISNTFRKGLRSHGRDIVSQERNFGNAENVLGRVQKDAVILELGEEGTKVLVVFLGGNG